MLGTVLSLIGIDLKRQVRHLVLTTVFAQATGSQRRGGFGVPNAVVRQVLDGAAPPGRAVSTGPCAE